LVLASEVLLASPLSQLQILPAWQSALIAFGTDVAAVLAGCCCEGWCWVRKQALQQAVIETSWWTSCRLAETIAHGVAQQLFL